MLLNATKTLIVCLDGGGVQGSKVERGKVK